MTTATHILSQDGKLESKRIAGPRFIKAASVDEIDLSDEGGLVYVQLDVSASDYQEQCRQLDELTKAQVIAGGAVRVDRAELQISARRAASAVRESSSIGEASRRFVRSMALDQAVDRSSVTALVSSFIEAARGVAKPAGGASISVAQIQVSGFASYDEEMTLNLPSSGLVVIEGDNGCGKTALIEAVSHACWDESIKDRARGCWRDVRDGSIASVQLADETWITRKKERARKRVRVIESGALGVEFDQPTRMKDQLASLLGQFSVWRNTCVFTSSSGSFTGATDGQRKRMLESVLGVSIFDRALDLCRAAAKSLSGDRVKAEADQGKLIERRRGCAQRLADHEQSLARIEAEVINLVLPEKPTELIPIPIEDIDTAAVVDLQSLAEFDDEDANAALAESRAALSDRRRQLRGLDLRSSCASCGSELDPSQAQAQAERLRAEVDSWAARELQAAELARGTSAKLRRARGVVDQAQRMDAGREANARLETQHQGRVKQWADQCLRIQADYDRRVDDRDRRRDEQGAAKMNIDLELIEVSCEIEDYEISIASMVMETLELEAAEAALGLRGIRANIMTDLLETIEGLANRWLEDLGDLKIRLRPFSPMANGGMKDEIHLEIVGAGGGHYGDASQGQQRRIDIAVLLALSEAAGGLDTSNRSTLFFDEVFDALDPRGQRGMAKILRELSEDRACVIITHVPSLAAELRPDITVTVTASLDPAHPENGPRHARLAVKRSGSRVVAVAS